MKLNAKELNQKLKELNGWSLNDNSIIKIFRFDNFLESINFVNKIAPLAQNLNHHPDIEINYNKVKIILSTHDEGGVTEKDINLSLEIENLK